MTITEYTGLMLDLNPKNKNQIYWTASHITLANFLFGYTIGVFNTCQDNVAYSMGWSDSEQSLYGTLFSTFVPIGAFFGSAVTAYLCNNLGRLKSVVIMDSCMIVGSILSCFSFTAVFGIGRLVCGFSVGICLAIAPMYLAEMTPQNMMGTTGPFMALFMSFGLTISYGYAFALPSDDFSQSINDFWKFMFIFPGLIAFYQSMYFLFKIKDDTPLFYLRKKNYEKYQKVLGKIFDSKYIPSIEEIQTRENDSINTRFIETMTYKDLICNKTYFKMLRIGVILASLQQLSGVNAIIFYSFSIYRVIGLSIIESKIFTFMIGITLILSSLATICLLRYYGRKRLLFWGHGLIAVDLLLVGFISQFSSSIVYFLAALIVAYFVFFAVGLQATLWSYIGEIQTEKAVSISTAFNYIMNIIVNIAFPFAVDSVGVFYAFYFFGICMVLATIYISYDVIETKNKKKEEIELILFANSKVSNEQSR